jgi:eukaryotic-like serine/threonine-protein kinase
VSEVVNNPAKRPTTQVDSEPDPATPFVDVAEPEPPVVRDRGESIGRYVVVDVIGYGGMGVVYAAWDPQLDRRIALKLVNLGTGRGVGAQGDSTREMHRLRLLREAQALARLEHPNVVKVHDVGVCRTGEPGAAGEEQVFIAMEFIAGQSLREWLRTGKRRLRPILDIFLAAGRGLAAAHAAGLVHRDFKPDNVLVGEGEEEGGGGKGGGRAVKVVDFGLARDARADERSRSREWAETEPAVAAALERIGDAIEDAGPLPPGIPRPIEHEPSAGHSIDSQRSLFASPGTITMTGTVLGTPAYMAPEQHARATVDARSDQYSFCVALWEAVYGKRPFSGRRADVLAERKRKLQIRESSRGLRVPRWLRSFLLRGLSVDPRRRFADMDALLAELDSHLQAHRRRWVPALGLTGALLLGLVVAGANMLGVGRDATPCAAPIERLEGVWDGPRRAAVERALLASDLVYADDTWRRVAAGLDEYRERWLAAEVEACEATQLRHEHDGEWLERHLACLDERRRELASLTDQLSRADAKTVEYAARAVGSLAPISACDDEQGAVDLTPMPAESHLRLRVERQLDQLADARALLSSGHLDDSLAAAQAVLASDASQRWPALAGEAELVIGSILTDLDGDPFAATRRLHSAARSALRGGHPRLAALTWSRIARGQVRTREFADAERWLDYAARLAPKLGREDPALAADFEHTRAQLRFAQGEFAEAEVHARRRLELLRGLYGPDNPRVADGLNNLGVTVYMQGRRDEAVAAYREALAILEAVQGPDHPSVATMHNNIGVVSTDRTLYAEALDHYRQAVDIRQRVFPRGHELCAQSLINLANVHLFSGDYGPGVAPALATLLASGERLAQRHDRSQSATASELARSELELVPDYLRVGRLFAGAGEHRNALTSFSRALALLDAVPEARLPPGFEAPPAGEPWPAHLEGCRADVLFEIEASARVLGRERDASWALAERSVIPVKQPAWARRCLEELGGYLTREP